MRYKVGDRVVVAYPNSKDVMRLKGQTGVVVDIDEEWTNPYDIDFDDKEANKLELLFMESELLLVGAEKEKKYIDIQFKSEESDEGATVEEVLDVLIDKVLHSQDDTMSIDSYLKNINIVNKLKEAKFWITEYKGEVEK